ncbi:MAG: alpha-beta hydrolase superfamily protein [Pseudobdellovibrio sp.]|jgi:NTE family protein|nr:alpha-beta hydrolase superfamily protein [Pseudobdellovibrio sp.]
MEKNAIKLLFVTLLLAGCATKKPAPVIAEKPKSSQVYNEKDEKPAGTQQPSDVKSDTETPAQNTPAPTPTPAPVEANAGSFKSVPRVGIIFSAGGAKAWGHIGVIKEIEKAKWPVKAVAGLEWGAAVAASYAHKLSANEVEWELSKVRDLEDVEQASETIFENQSVNDLKVPFVCPSLNIVKQEAFLLNRGQLKSLMPFCISSPGLSGHYKQSIGLLDHISALSQHMRATGVKKVILVNVLAQGSKKPLVSDVTSAENILWVKAAVAAAQKPAGVDDVININLDDYSIKDLDQKREIIARGAELSYDQIKKLSTKYGL